MDSNIAIQLILSIGAAIGAAFGAYKYSLTQSLKREKTFFDYIERKDKEQLEYNTRKNGHMERIAKGFTTASNKMSKSINNLATQVALIKK